MAWKPFALAAALVAVVEVLVRAFDVPTYIMPAPSEIFVELFQRWDYFLPHVPPTAFEIWAGFVLALIVGIALAIPVALTRFGEEALMPLIVASDTIPKVALAPIFVIWFGFDLTPKVVIAALIAFFPIVVNTVRGLRSVDPEIVQYMSTLGASGWDIFRKLRIPSSLPYLLSAMKISISLATVGAIVGEFVGADRGVGYVIIRAIANFDTVTMFSGLVIISVIGVISYSLIALLEQRALSWEPNVNAMNTTA